MSLRATACILFLCRNQLPPVRIAVNTKGYVRLSILSFEVLLVKFRIVHFAL